MTRQSTSNYGAVTDTQFAWATSDADIFDRELDLYRQAQALENHDHSSTRGLAVTRLAAGVVVDASLAALAVTEAKIATGAVTNTKLGAGAVTRDKISWPLIQPSNDMAGGYSQRDTSNTYAVGFYIAANGLAVLGSGTVGTIGSNMVMGQAGQVSIGATQGAAKFNVMQSVDGATTLASGFRIYNPNTLFFNDLVSYSGHLGIFAQGVGALWIDATNKFVTVGTAVSGVARLVISQAAGTAVEGAQWVFGAGRGKVYVDASGHFHVESALTTVQLMNTPNAFTPAVDNATTLGQPALRWSTIYGVAVTATSVSAGTLSSTGNISASGTVSATSGTFGGITAGVSTINGTLATAQVRPINDNSVDSGDTSQRWRYVHVATGIGVALGGAPGAQIQLGSDSAVKPSTNTWQVASDIRVKHEDRIHDYDAGLEQILALRPVHYWTNGLYGTDDMPEDSTPAIGFVADEVEKVCPEMVGSIEAFRTDQATRPAQIKTVNTHALPIMTVNAIKELHAQIQELRHLVEELRN